MSGISVFDGGFLWFCRIRERARACTYKKQPESAGFYTDTGFRFVLTISGLQLACPLLGGPEGPIEVDDTRFRSMFRGFLFFCAQAVACDNSAS